MLANLLGYKNKIVPGYKGTGPALLALERGEIDARCSVWASLAVSTYKGDFDAGKFVPILQVGTRKHPAFGSAPLILDLAKTEEQRTIMRFLVGPLEISRPFAAPPGVPADRVKALRTALWNTANSDGIKADAKKMKLVVDPMTGEDTEAALRAALDVSPDIVKKGIKAITE
jgi:tripartite-type tricarboxylate transporter receptor subunit TctC